MNRTSGLTKKKVLLLVGTYLLAGLLVVEVGVRLLLYREWRHQMKANHGQHIPDSVVGYRLAAGTTVWGAKVNSLGYRGREFSLNKPEGSFRIVCSGNSITFGEAASCDSTTYPFVLEKLIRERGEIARPIEVINAGVLGYTSYQCLMDLKTRLLALHPDLIIFCVGWNDMTFSKYIGWTPHMNWQNPWLLWTMKDSYSVWLLNERFLHLPAGVSSGPLNAFADNLDRIISLCKQKNVALAFLDLPTMFAQEMTPSEERKCRLNYFVRGEIPIYTAYMSTMKEIAVRQNIRIFDTGLTYTVSGKDSLIVDVCHPNDRGYRHMVGALYPQMRDEVLRIMRMKQALRDTDRGDL